MECPKCGNMMNHNTKKDTFECRDCGFVVTEFLLECLLENYLLKKERDELI